MDRNSFRATDSLVSALGPMRDSSLGSIVKALTKGAPDDLTKLRAIYMWVAKNVAYDCPRRQHPERVNNTTSYVIRSRIATSEGFAGMMSEMCRMCYLRCETVRGMAKWSEDEIGNVDPETAVAAWNVVHIGVRSYVLDAGAGAGFCEGRSFNPKLTDAWFLTQRRLFVLCHFPQDKKMQLLDTPVDKGAFINAPIIYPFASIIGLYPLPGQRGILKGREGDSIRLSLLLSQDQEILNTSVIMNGVKTEISFIHNDGLLTVTIPFSESGSARLVLFVNNSPGLGFMAEVARRQRR